jgi:hypothetical protein
LAAAVLALLLMPSRAEDAIAGRSEACRLLSARIDGWIKSGNLKEARRHHSQHQSCLEAMKRDLRERVLSMIDDYENLIRRSWHSGTYPGPRTFLDACEHALKERLKAPSTYRRISATELTPVLLSVEEYVSAHQDRKAYETLALANSSSPVRLSALVSYDAANAFGTPLRHSSECIYDASGVSEIPGPYAIKVDGTTNIERLFIKVGPEAAAAVR